MLPTSRCVVLVPVGGAIDPGCEDAMRELERRGYAVWRVRGYSAIDAARNQMASDALAQGFDELMWINSDGVFDPDDVDKLRQHNLPSRSPGSGVALALREAHTRQDHSGHLRDPLVIQTPAFRISEIHGNLGRLSPNPSSWSCRRRNPCDKSLHASASQAWAEHCAKA
jgi:hypothetical protein